MRNITIKRIHIILLVIILIVSLPIYRVYLRQVIDAKLYAIQVQDLDITLKEYYEGELHLSDGRQKM